MNETMIMVVLAAIGVMTWIYTIMMIVRYKKHPRLTMATIIIMAMTLAGLPTDLYWIILVALTIYNGHRQKKIAAMKAAKAEKRRNRRNKRKAIAA